MEAIREFVTRSKQCNFRFRMHARKLCAIETRVFSSRIWPVWFFIDRFSLRRKCVVYKSVVVKKNGKIRDVTTSRVIETCYSFIPSQKQSPEQRRVEKLSLEEGQEAGRERFAVYTYGLDGRLNFIAGFDLSSAVSCQTLPSWPVAGLAKSGPRNVPVRLRVKRTIVGLCFRVIVVLALLDGALLRAPLVYVGQPLLLDLQVLFPPFYPAVLKPHFNLDNNNKQTYRYRTFSSRQRNRI